MSPLVCLLRLWRGSRKPHLGSLPGRGRQVCVERQTGVAPLVWRLGGSARPFQGGHSPFPWCHSAYVLHSSRTGVAASSSLAVARQLARNAPRLNEGAWQLLIAKIGRKMAQFGRDVGRRCLNSGSVLCHCPRERLRSKFCDLGAPVSSSHCKRGRFRCRCSPAHRCISAARRGDRAAPAGAANGRARCSRYCSKPLQRFTTSRPAVSSRVLPKKRNKEKKSDFERFVAGSQSDSLRLVLQQCTGSRLPGLTRQGGKYTLQRPKSKGQSPGPTVAVARPRSQLCHRSYSNKYTASRGPGLASHSPC